MPAVVCLFALCVKAATHEGTHRQLTRTLVLALWGKRAEATRASFASLKV